ncbi:MAG: UDP-N-acetylmuramoyl-tripeptide--D-alanyl-D-alanine ligase [Deltaproteobacteria bacterium]|nr:UDP-N-acetylmuramoyl-tripeptide--D-alanyl-D-alanine ligase [Deltaproteobacteria bacterium]
MQWTTDDILVATAGEWICGNRNIQFSGIAIDSRMISLTEFFVAIRGEFHDGHRFCSDVVQSGVKGILIDIHSIGALPIAEWRQKGIACIGVKDTTRALGDLAAYHRRRCSVSVVAITGSNGKTTTRSMTSDILCRRFKVLSTAGNFNNHIGLPLTLLNLEREHEWAVLELGMNHSGEIDRLSEICQPNIGVITTIGTAHLENFASTDGILQAKAEIFAHLQHDGLAVLNMDDPKLLELSGRLSVPVIFFGLNPGARVRARQVETRSSGTSFFLDLPEETVEVRLPVAGTFMATNALAAATVGYALGLPGDEIKAALENFKPVKGRMNVIESARWVHIVDDTYNANPVSMAAAIQTLQKIKGEHRGILVIGDMLELGKESLELHRKIGEIAATSGIAALYATGRFASAVAQGAAGQGMDSGRIFVGDRQAICEHLKGDLKKGDWVLIKGSRAMGMEKIVHDIADWAECFDSPDLSTKSSF